MRVNIADPTNAVFLRRAAASRQCHDNNVIMGTVNLAMCAGGNGLSVFSFDPALDPAAPGGLENPTLLYSKPITGVGVGHSGSFTYDGKVLVFGHEPGGGSQAQCQTTSSLVNRSIYFIEPRTGTELGTYQHQRPQTNRENCTWHNFNIVPTYRGYAVRLRQLPVRHLGGGLHQPDRAARGRVRGSGAAQRESADRPRWRLVDLLAQRQDLRVRHPPRSDHVGPRQRADEPAPRRQPVEPADADDDLRPRLRGSGDPDRLAGRRREHAVDAVVQAGFGCTDSNSGVESCVGTVAGGAPINTSTTGAHTFTVTATDKAGNVTTKSVTYNVLHTSVDGNVSGTVPGTLSLTVGNPASLRRVHAGRREGLLRDHRGERDQHGR